MRAVLNIRRPRAEGSYFLVVTALERSYLLGVAAWRRRRMSPGGRGGRVRRSLRLLPGCPFSNVGILIVTCAGE